MPSIVFSNFKGGLDVRRSQLTTEPGALVQLQDAIVNEGAEIENRKAFTLASNAAASTYGLEAITAGLLTFGSIADPGGWTAPVSYQQLKHPAVYLGGVFNATYHAMTSVNCSTSFAGAAWVVATFADGNTYAFNNGVPVYAFYAGTVLHAMEAVDKLAGIISTNIDAVSGFSISAITTAAGQSYFDFWSDVGLNYTPVITDPSGVVVTTGGGYIQTVTSGSGTLTLQQTFNSVTPIAGVQAVGSFYVTGGSTAGSGQVTVIKVNGVTVTSAAVPFNTTNAQTALDIATNINNFISTPKYSATVSTYSDVSQVVISATVSGTASNGYVIEVDASGDFTVDNTAIDFSKGTPTTGATCTNITPAGGVNLISGGPPTLSGTNYNAWVTAIASNIRAFTGTTGYTAFATGSVLWVSKLTRLSSDTIPATIAITTSSGTPADVHSTNITSSTPLTVLAASSTSFKVTTKFPTSSALKLNIAGGTTPYTFQWILASETGNWNINSPTAASTTVVDQGTTFTLDGITLHSAPVVGDTCTVFCQVKDKNGLVGTSPTFSITVST